MDVFAALSDPTRRNIVALLACGERSAGDIWVRFDMAGPSVSRHLKVLRESGLITYRREATTRFYRLEAKPLAEARQWMDTQLKAVNAQFHALGTHLDQMKQREEDDG